MNEAFPLCTLDKSGLNKAPARERDYVSRLQSECIRPYDLIARVTSRKCRVQNVACAEIDVTRLILLSKPQREREREICGARFSTCARAALYARVIDARRCHREAIKL